jgi:hypothetical protein
VRTFLFALAVVALAAGAAAQAPGPAGGPQPHYVAFLRPNPARKALPQADRVLPW